MTIQDASDKMKNYILQEYNKTQITPCTGIHRGHLRALSTEIEDAVAMFALDILPVGYEALVDVSARVDNKTHRPDILIIDSNSDVKALIEVKTNMGWCRDATTEIGKIIAKHNALIREGKVTCKFSHEVDRKVNYSTDTQVFVVSLTDSNCSEDRHRLNKRIAMDNGVKQYNLFSGWYESLCDLEILDFSNDIIK